MVHGFPCRYLSFGLPIHSQVTSSSPKLSEYSQVWVHLSTMANNTLILPGCAKNNKPRIWLTHFVASGLTGNDWQCPFDNHNDLFTVKIVEVLRNSDTDNQEWLHIEFEVYLILDEAY